MNILRMNSNALTPNDLRWGGYYCAILNEFDSPAALAVDKDIRRVLTPKVSVPFFRMWCFAADCVCGVLQQIAYVVFCSGTLSCRHSGLIEN